MFEIHTVLITGTAIFLGAILLGALIKPSFFDGDSRLFGAWIGFVIGGSVATTVMVIMTIAHFAAKVW